MPKLQEAIMEAAIQSGEVGFRNDYSGRGMFGRSCVGITGSIGNCMAVVGAVIKTALRDDLDATVDAMLDFSQDSMGYDVIMYWPALEPIKFPEPEEDEPWSH